MNLPEKDDIASQLNPTPIAVCQPNPSVVRQLQIPVQCVSLIPASAVRKLNPSAVSAFTKPSDDLQWIFKSEFY